MHTLTTDYLVCFTNIGNYAVIPVHKLTENRFKDEGVHINSFVALNPGEKLIKAIAVHTFRNDIYLAFLTRFGQIKRMSLSSIESIKRSRPARCMKLLNGDEISGVQVLTGNSDLLVVTSNGFVSCYNENELSILGSKAGGVKSFANLGKNQTIGLLSFDENERAKVVLFTDKGHQRTIDINKVTRTARLGKSTEVCPSFKGDQHKVVSAVKIPKELEKLSINLYLQDNSAYRLVIDDFRMQEAKYAKKNIDIPNRAVVTCVFDTNIENINKNSISHPITVKEPKVERLMVEPQNEENDEIDENMKDVDEVSSLIEEEIPEETVVKEEKENVNPAPKKKQKEEKSFEQISIFDIDDDE